jgi:hypothetical protein
MPDVVPDGLRRVCRFPSCRGLLRCAYTHADADRDYGAIHYTFPNTNPYIHSHINLHRYAIDDADRDSHEYTLCHANSNRHAYLHPNGYPFSYAHAAASGNHRTDLL